MGSVCTLKSSAVGHVCAMLQAIFGQWHMSVMWNACRPKFLFTLLLALGPNETYILIQMCHMWTRTNWHMWLICDI